MWQSILSFELHVQTLPEIGLNAQCLQNEDAHSDHALLGWVIPILHCVEDAEDDEIMRSARVDDKRPESLVALKRLPEQNEHLRRPFDRPLTTGKIGVRHLHL